MRITYFIYAFSFLLVFSFTCFSNTAKDLISELTNNETKNVKESGNVKSSSTTVESNDAPVSDNALKSTYIVQIPENRIYINLPASQINTKTKNTMQPYLAGVRAGPKRNTSSEIIGFKFYKLSEKNIFIKFGLKSGDILIAINNKNITSTEIFLKQLESLSNLSPGSIITFQIQRSEKLYAIIVTLVDK